MQLIFLRHGVAVERDDWNGGDDSRPLTPEGAQKTRGAAHGLDSICEPELLASSPKTRAVQTAELARMVWKKAPLELWSELAFDDFDLWLARLRDANVSSVLLVGHEPDLGRFASLLLCGDADAVQIPFKKAGALSLELDLQTNRATLGWMIPPRVLRSLAT